MKYKINLITKKAPPLVERLVYFSLNYLRYIIVITQLVVIGVFFYRFQIDQRIIDLKDAVDQKKQIVQIVLPLLNEADNIDKRSSEIDKIIKKQNNFHSMTKYILSIFPASINLNDFEISADTVKITGSAQNAEHLQSFYSVLKKDKKFALVQFASIKKTDFGYDFSLLLNKYGQN